MDAERDLFDQLYYRLKPEEREKEQRFFEEYQQQITERSPTHG